MSRVMMIGGHGKIALLTAPLLVGAGHDVTSVVRNPAHTAEVEATRAQAVVADVERLSTDELSELIAGRDALIWSAGAGGGTPARTYAVDRDAAIRSMDAALAAGVKRYVMVSYYGAGVNHGVPEDNGFFPYADAKTAADAYLRGTGLEWTILRPSRLTSESASARIEAHFEFDADPTGAREVSRANVAAVLKATLDIPASIGRAINFNDGEEPIAQALERLRT